MWAGSTGGVAWPRRGVRRLMESGEFIEHRRQVRGACLRFLQIRGVAHWVWIAEASSCTKERSSALRAAAIAGPRRRRPTAAASATVSARRAADLRRAPAGSADPSSAAGVRAVPSTIFSGRPWRSSGHFVSARGAQDPEPVAAAQGCTVVPATATAIASMRPLPVSGSGRLGRAMIQANTTLAKG